MSVEASGQPSLAATFGAAGVASAYEHRPPYPTEVFRLLADLVVQRPSRVLDIGAGEGALARPLAERVDHVDAVDMSAAMVTAGRRRPGGNRSNLRWIVGAVETCELSGPYSLVTAGASLHWMDWTATLARLRAVMTAGAVLAVVEHGPAAPPWGTDLLEVIRRHSRARDYDPHFSVVDALAEGGLLDIQGQRETRPVLFRQSVQSYIEQFHSTASLARELMPEEEWRRFDASVAEVVGPWAEDGVLAMQIVATVAWGRPS